MQSWHEAKHTLHDTKIQHDLNRKLAERSRNAPKMPFRQVRARRDAGGGCRNPLGAAMCGPAGWTCGSVSWLCPTAASPPESGRSSAASVHPPRTLGARRRSTTSRRTRRLRRRLAARAATPTLVSWAGWTGSGASPRCRGTRGAGQSLGRRRAAAASAT
eukprot:6800738-Prymnesium_polylepis.1